MHDAKVDFTVSSEQKLCKSNDDFSRLEDNSDSVSEIQKLLRQSFEA